MNKMQLEPGMTVGKLTLIEPEWRDKWHCVCSCGRHSHPVAYNLRRGLTRSCGYCGKNNYTDLGDGRVSVTSTNGIAFLIDKSDEVLVKQHKWHVCTDSKGYHMVISSRRVKLDNVLLGHPAGMEIDHIDLNPLNNCRNNLRIVSHQCNQINQPPQSNCKSGVSGVQYYARYKQYRARIKIGQKDIHLGYYESFQQAVQARNVGMECMFGEYGRYNDVPPAPEWIRQKVIKQCERFAELSVCRAFLLKYAKNSHEGGRAIGYQRKKAPAHRYQGA